MLDDDFDDLDDSAWGDADLAALEATAVVQQARPLQKQPTYTQQTLFGKPAPAPPPKAGPSRTSAPAEPKQPDFSVNKNWDRGIFKRVGWGTGAEQKGKKAKGKARALEPEDEFYDSYALEEEEIDHAHLYDDPELDPDRPPPPMALVYDEEAAKTFVYPLNKPKRDYQYNIVRRALFTNVLCALPTGLGKTFIAAVVMLNFYRWYPKGKIIFMAPTRPLVNQQIEACHAIAGIPASDAALITGQDQPANRQNAWQQRRVFYATPQTVVNDLRTAKLNPKEVICVVIDEAHKASGDYAYCGVVRYLMTKNPHFRILALTATPGSKSEAVQNVVDNLHIGHIEIRCEESLDLRQYIHKKEVVEQIVPVTGDVASIRDGIVEIMKPLAKRCFDAGLTRNPDPIRLKPYAIQVAQRECKQAKWAWPVLDKLRKLAQAMGYLLEHSLTACVEDLSKCISKKNGAEDQALQQLINQIRLCKSTPGYVPHPKMDALRSLLIDHFSRDVSHDTRIMVFCHYRGVVEEIVECLNEQKPLIRASRFVGQGTDTKGGKGFGQKQQQETIRRFKEGDFNTLVATSIGEEGLDIGEVDLIVCYDTNKSPIRMLQRVGRTGRARQGKIVVLLTEGRDEQNWKSAQDNYAVVQHAILSGKALELYADCERLLPKGHNPEPDLRPVDVEPFDHAALSIGAGGKRKAAAETGVKGTKRKRDYVPEGANTGFATATELMDKTPLRSMSPEPTLEERERAACLDEEELAYLNDRWRGSTHTLDNKLEHTTTSLGPPFTSRIGRSERHSKLRRAIENGEELSTSVESLYRWKKPAYKAFNPDLVVWWDEKASKGSGTRPFVSCRRPERSLRDATAPVDTGGREPSVLPLSPPQMSRQATQTLKAEPMFPVYGLPDSDDEELPDASTVLSRPLASKSTESKSATAVIDLDSDGDTTDPAHLFNDDVMVEHADDDAFTLISDEPPVAINHQQSAPLFAIGGLSSSSPAPPHSPEVVIVRATMPHIVKAASTEPESVPASSPCLPISSPIVATRLRSASPTTAQQGERPLEQLERKASGDSFEDLDAFDDDAFEELDRAEAQLKSEADLMPPPPLPTSTVRKPPSMSHQISASVVHESPVTKHLVADLDDTSSPGVVLPGRRTGPPPPPIQASDDSTVSKSAARPINGRRLVRASEKRPASEHAATTGNTGVASKRREKRIKVDIHRNGLFDVEAINDDDSNEASSEKYESENESDRAFVDQTMTSDGGSADMDIYRISMASQAPNFGFDPARRPGAFKMRFVGGFDPSKVDPDDSYERDSFCASDGEDLEFQTSSQTQAL